MYLLIYSDLASGHSFNSLLYQYLLGASRIREIATTTCEQLWSVLQLLFISSKQEEDWIKVADDFYQQIYKFSKHNRGSGRKTHPNGTTGSRTSYLNYEKFFSCVVMAWVDADYKFVAIDVGSFGTCRDSEIFSNSNIGRCLVANQLIMEEDYVMIKTEP